MQIRTAITVALAAASLCSVDAGTASPIGKVVQLISDLQAKITKEGEVAQKMHDEYLLWCEDRNANLNNEIKIGRNSAAELSATIENEKATNSELSAKIEELAASIATNEADLKAATDVRAKEAADFAAEDAELSEVISMLERALHIIQQEMAKGGAAMVQLKNADTVTQALAALVQAAAFSAADASRLTSLVQNSQQSDDDDVGAPDSAVYKSHSGGIADTLASLLEKAEAQLADARKKENTSKSNFNMLEQSLNDEIKFRNQDMADAKKNRAASNGNQASAEGDHLVTTKALNEDINTLADVQRNCQSAAEDFDAATKSRAEELAALAEAKKAINDKTGAAEDISYGLNQVSLLQLSSGTDLANFEAVRFVRDLAQKQGAPELAQLAARMASTLRLGAANGADPFAKVKGLISDMIARLEETATQEAEHNAWCVKSLAIANEKKADLSARISKLTTKIDQDTARSTKLNEETATLQKELSELAASQAAAAKLRSDQNAVFTQEKADMEAGLEGVKMALSVLREYYATGDKAHEEAAGAGSSIISLLEVCESDFSKSLADIEATESSAAIAFDQDSKDNEIEKVTKEQDVKYKTREITKLARELSADKSDRAGLDQQFKAVTNELASLTDQCTYHPETYEERKRRRDAEIAGLKQALEILSGEAALLQRTTRRSHRASFLQAF